MSKTREFHRPENWQKAHQLLKRSDVNSVVVHVSPRPTALDDIQADAFIDLEKLNLNQINQSEDGVVHIGGSVTLQQLYQSDLIKAQVKGILSEAAYYSATLGLRHLASITGALLDPKSPPDIALALMVLDATVLVKKNESETRQVPVADWMKDCANALLPGEIIWEVSFKDKSSVLGALVRINRTPRDHAMLAAAAALNIEDRNCASAGVALAGANPTPVRLADVEASLLGKPLSPEFFNPAAQMAQDQAEPVADYLGSVEYRRAMAGVLVKRVLIQASKTI
jgi:carbon-monoxide dehydrogenase medium subunit